MLSREVMGLLALAALWLNTLLVLAAAGQEWSRVRALQRRLRRAAARGELVQGDIVDPDGHPFAVRRVQQRGRAVTTPGPARILFADGPQDFEVRGGLLRTARGDVRVGEATGADAEVWLAAERERGEASRRDSASFEAAWRGANTSQGFSRELLLEVRAPARVWVMGAIDAQGQLVSREGQPLLVSAVDPLGDCAAKARLLLAFVVSAASALVLVTALAAWPPAFGPVSTVGGVLGLAYFLGIQPVGTAVRDAVRTPAKRAVGALWHRP